MAPYLNGEISGPYYQVVEIIIICLFILCLLYPQKCKGDLTPLENDVSPYGFHLFFHVCPSNLQLPAPKLLALAP